jgi:hypothetical protein
LDGESGEAVLGGVGEEEGARGEAGGEEAADDELTLGDEDAGVVTGAERGVGEVAVVVEAGVGGVGDGDEHGGMLTTRRVQYWHAGTGHLRQAA